MLTVSLVMGYFGSKHNRTQKHIRNWRSWFGK